MIGRRARSVVLIVFSLVLLIACLGSCGSDDDAADGDAAYSQKQDASAVDDPSLKQGDSVAGPTTSMPIPEPVVEGQVEEGGTDSTEADSPATTVAPGTTAPPATTVQQAQEPIRILAVGDSITWGYGAPETDPNGRDYEHLGFSYRCHLWGRLLEGFPGVEFEFVGDVHGFPFNPANEVPPTSTSCVQTLSPDWPERPAHHVGQTFENTRAACAIRIAPGAVPTNSRWLTGSEKRPAKTRTRWTNGTRTGSPAAAT